MIKVEHYGNMKALFTEEKGEQKEKPRIQETPNDKKPNTHKSREPTTQHNTRI